MFKKPLLPLSLTALAFILIGTAVTVNTKEEQQASVAVAQQQSLIPTFETKNITVQEGQVARLTITFPEPVTRVTRVQFSVTSGTARIGTDFVRPQTQTVVFQPNGIPSRTISIRTRIDNIQEADETFFVTLTRVNGRTITPQDRATVTITDNTPTTTGATPLSRPQQNSVTNEAQAKNAVTTPTPTQPVATRPVTGGTGVNTAPVAPTAPASSRCVAGQSQARFATEPARAGMRTELMYDVGKSYHMPFSVPVNWSQKTGWDSVELFRQDVMGPFGDGNEYRPGTRLDMDLSISECPGDFNPQTACVGKSAAVNNLHIMRSTSSRDPGTGSQFMGMLYGCEIQGGKQYYLNTRVNECGGSSVCGNRTSAGNAPSLFLPPNWWTKQRCDENLASSLRDASGNIVLNEGIIWCRAWGHIQ